MFRGPITTIWDGWVPWGPFHKSFCAVVKTPAELRSKLGVKSNPAKREMNVWFSFIKEIHAGAEARRRGFDFYAGRNVMFC